MARQRQDSIRAPKQARSQQRVDQILDAARDIVAARGSAALSIVDIAESAGITAGSMYQYFPNKTAILCALAERYLDEFGRRMAEKLAVIPQDYTSAMDTIDEIVELFFQMNQQDPVMRDIMFGIVSDKSLRELSRRDSEAKIDALCAALVPVVPPARRDDLRLSILLMTEFVEAAVRAALDMPALEARRTIDRLKAMIRAIWVAGI